jgi:hypothetical protein
VEWANRTVMTIARTMIISSELLNYLYLKALKHAAYVKNRLLHTKTGKLPIDIFTIRNINRSSLRLFGEPVWIHLINIPHNLAPRVVEGWIIGYNVFH